jgi:hypothetical protein
MQGSGGVEEVRLAFLCGFLLLHLTLAIGGALERSRGRSGFLETNIGHKESLMSRQGDDEFDYTIKLTLTLPGSRTHSRLIIWILQMWKVQLLIKKW